MSPLTDACLGSYRACMLCRNGRISNRQTLLSLSSKVETRRWPYACVALLCLHLGKMIDSVRRERRSRSMFLAPKRGVEGCSASKEKHHRSMHQVPAIILSACSSMHSNLALFHGCKSRKRVSVSLHLLLALNVQSLT